MQKQIWQKLRLKGVERVKNKRFLSLIAALLLFVLATCLLPASSAYAAAGTVRVNGIEVYDTKNILARNTVANALNAYYNPRNTNYCFFGFHEYDDKLYRACAYVNGRYIGGEAFTFSFADGLTDTQFPCEFIDNLSYWDCGYKDFTKAFNNYKVNSSKPTQGYYDSLGYNAQCWVQIMGEVLKAYDYYDFNYDLSSDTTLAEAVAHAKGNSINSISNSVFSMNFKHFKEFCNRIAKYDEGTMNIKYAYKNYVAYGGGNYSDNTKQLAANYINNSDLGRSVLSQIGENNEVYAVSGKVASFDVANESSGAKGIMKIVMNSFGALIYFIGWVVSGILGLLQISLDAIIMGRVNGNGIMVDGHYTTLFQFGLEPGNVYGTVAAAIYSVIRQYAFLIMSVVAMFMYIKSILSFAPPKASIMDDGGTGKITLSVVKNIAICFAALMLMPMALQGALELRDMGVYYLTKDIRLQLFGSGAGALSIEDSVRPSGLSDGNLLFKSVLWCVVLGSEFVFLLNYLGYALHGVVLVAVFPFVCVRALMRGPRFFNEWINSFVGVLIYPLVDSIIFMLPSAFLKIGESFDAGGQIAFSLIAALLIYLFKPMRHIVFDVLDIKGSSTESATSGAVSAIKGFVGSVVRKSTAGKKDSQASSGTSASESAEKTREAAEAAQASAENADTAAEGASVKNGEGLQPIKAPETSQYRTAFFNKKAELHAEMEKDREKGQESEYNNAERATKQDNTHVALGLTGDFRRKFVDRIKDNAGTSSLNMLKGVASGYARFGPAVAGAALGAATGNAVLGASAGYGVGRLGTKAVARGAQELVNLHRDKQDYDQMVSDEIDARKPSNQVESMKNEIELQGSGKPIVMKDGENLLNIPTAKIKTYGDNYEDLTLVTSHLDDFDNSDISVEQREFVQKGADNVLANADYFDNAIKNFGGCKEMSIIKDKDGNNVVGYSYDTFRDRKWLRDSNAPALALKELSREMINDCKLSPEKYSDPTKVMEMINSKYMTDDRIAKQTRIVVGRNMAADDSPYLEKLNKTMNEAALSSEHPRTLSGDHNVDVFANKQVVQYMADKFVSSQEFLDDDKLLNNLKYSKDEYKGNQEYNAEEDYLGGHKKMEAIRSSLSEMSPEEVPEQLRFLFR